MKNATLKLSHPQLEAFLAVMPGALEALTHGDLNDQLLGAVLQQVHIKLIRHSYVIKSVYKPSLVPAEQVAMVMAKMLGLFDTNTHSTIMTGNALTALQQQLA